MDAAPVYEVRCAPCAELTVQTELHDLPVHLDAHGAVIIAVLDKTQLQSILERIERLHLVLLDVLHLRPRTNQAGDARDVTR